MAFLIEIYLKFALIIQEARKQEGKNNGGN